MASLSLKSFYPIEETSSLLLKTEENSIDYERLKVLTFQRMCNECSEEELNEIETLLSNHR
jgi:hypothetical protein